jgi:hypothetical protein
MQMISAVPSKVIGVLLLCATLPLAFAQKQQESEWISLIGLIATPERYDGKLVHVTGWATIEFENTALCLSDRPVSTKECVWLEIVEGPLVTSSYTKAEESWKKFHRRVITLQGRFLMRNNGHMGAYSGSIGQVTKTYLHQKSDELLK